MKRILLLTVLLLLPLPAAGQISPTTAQEIAGLLHFIKTAACRFNRNGTWYSPSEAAGHIDKKYRYALSNGQVHSAEDFIRLAASASSLSGAPYTVQCQGSPTLRSADWLTAELRRIRNR